MFSHEEQSKEIELPDWIWAIQWLCETRQLAAAQGHNAVVLLSCITGRIMEEVHCEDKCILYSCAIRNRARLFQFTKQSFMFLFEMSAKLLFVEFVVLCTNIINLLLVILPAALTNQIQPEEVSGRWSC